MLQQQIDKLERDMKELKSESMEREKQATSHALAILNNCIFVTADNRHISKTAQFGHVVLLKDWQSVFNS